MTPDEFEFWQRAYLAALTGVAAVPDPCSNSVNDTKYAGDIAKTALHYYRTAKATVVQTTYATAD